MGEDGDLGFQDGGRASSFSFLLAFGVTAHDGNLDDEAFLDQDGELAMGKRELARHGGRHKLGQAVEVACLDGGGHCSA